MLSLVFYRVIKAASIAEKKSEPANAGYETFICNDGCLYHPLKHQRKHFIVYIYIFIYF
jgi:hypothetical protein